MDGWIDEGRMGGWVDNGWMDGCMCGWINGWIDEERMGEWMDGLVDIYKLGGVSTQRIILHDVAQ